MSEKGEGLRRKGIDCSQYQTFYRTPLYLERGAIMQFDWPVARQTQSNMRNDNLIIQHPGHDKIKIPGRPALATNGRRMTSKTTVGLGRGRRLRRDTAKWEYM